MTAFRHLEPEVTWTSNHTHGPLATACTGGDWRLTKKMICSLRALVSPVSPLLIFKSMALRIWNLEIIEKNLPDHEQHSRQTAATHVRNNWVQTLTLQATTDIRCCGLHSVSIIPSVQVTGCHNMSWTCIHVDWMSVWKGLTEFETTKLFIPVNFTFNPTTHWTTMHMPRLNPVWAHDFRETCSLQNTTVQSVHAASLKHGGCNRDYWSCKCGWKQSCKVGQHLQCQLDTPSDTNWVRNWVASFAPGEHGFHCPSMHHCFT